MKILNEQNEEVQDPDLELGHLEPEKLLIQHHDAVEYVAPVYGERKVAEYDNGGILNETYLISPEVPAQAAWDEYEDIQKYILYTEEELAEIQAQKEAEEQAQKEAEEAARKAEAEAQQQKLMTRAVSTMSLMMMPTMNFKETTNAAIASLAPLYSEWDSNGHSYKKGDPFTYTVNEVVKYFRASQDTVSTEIYKPGDAGTESIYYEFRIAADGYVIFDKPDGAYNAYNKGDIVHYPGEDGDLYECLTDGNAYSPDEYAANWKKLEEE